MANSIALFEKYIPLLDEVYAAEAKTAILDGDDTLVRSGSNTHTIQIPKMSMDGLGDYSRTSGYALGSVSIEYEEVASNYDRGRKFSIDVMDDEETAGLAVQEDQDAEYGDEHCSECKFLRFGIHDAYYNRFSGTLEQRHCNGKSDLIRKVPVSCSVRREK